MGDQLDVLLRDLAFPEGPRWRDGRLVFSDMHSREVLAVDLEGQVERICRVEGRPSGLGWLPDGRMLVVSMEDRRLLRLEGDGSLCEVADLSELATSHCNDMVVDTQGRAYVGNFGFDLHEKQEPRDAAIVLVDPDGRARIVAPEMSFPNGSVITPDGRTLIVGESFAARLTAFTIESDGSLSGRREWAKLEKAIPDGICLDAEGGIWVASPVGHQVLRVLEGGEVTDRIPVENESFACMLGGAEGKTLFVCTAGTSDPTICETERTGRIEFTEVDVPHAGLP